MKVPLSWLRGVRATSRSSPSSSADDLTLAGLAVERSRGTAATTVLDLDITTNRVDCMNVYGVAREVSVLYGVPLRAPDAHVPGEGRARAAARCDVEIEAPDLCPRFCARVLDVRIGPSPAWLRDRLELVGVRPDQQRGGPDQLRDDGDGPALARVRPGARCREARLVVRWAREGERLDDARRRRAHAGARGIGVVAGPAAPLALAGIMGGASSEVSDATRTVALEAAYWDPLAIRRGGQGAGHAHRGLASLRARRGPGRRRRGHRAHRAPAAQDRRRARRGPASSTATSRRWPRRAVDMRATPGSTALLGTPVPADEARRILTGLGFELRAGRPSAACGAGAHLARRRGARGGPGRGGRRATTALGRIPSTIPPSGDVEGLRPWQQRERELRAAAGRRRARRGDRATSFVSDAAGAARPARVALANPLSEEQGALRDALVFPGLLDALATNLRQRPARRAALRARPRLRCRDGARPRRGAAAGHPALGWGRAARTGRSRPRPADFFDVKGLLEASGAALGADGLEFTQRRAVPALLHPGRCARACAGAAGSVGYAGRAAPRPRARAGSCATRRSSRRSASTRCWPRRRPPSASCRCRAIPAVDARPVGPVPIARRRTASSRPRSGSAAGPLLRELACRRPLRGPAGAGGPGEPDAGAALPGPGPHADGRRGPGVDGRASCARCAQRGAEIRGE